MIQPQIRDISQFRQKHDCHVYHLYFYTCVSVTYAVSNPKLVTGGETELIRRAYMPFGSKIVLLVGLRILTCLYQCNVWVITIENYTNLYGSDFSVINFANLSPNLWFPSFSNH